MDDSGGQPGGSVNRRGYFWGWPSGRVVRQDQGWRWEEDYLKAQQEHYRENRTSQKTGGKDGSSLEVSKAGEPDSTSGRMWNRTLGTSAVRHLPGISREGGCFLAWMSAWGSIRRDDSGAGGLTVRLTWEQSLHSPVARCNTQTEQQGRRQTLWDSLCWLWKESGFSMGWIWGRMSLQAKVNQVSTIK